MYLNRIKHNVVTKLNPLTLNVGLDGRMHGQMDDRQKVITIADPEHSSGELINQISFCVILGLIVNRHRTAPS